MPQTKRKQTYDTSDPFVASNSGSPTPENGSTSIRPSKRSKPSNAVASSSKVPEKQKDDEGNPFWSISTARRVTVSDFKGKKMVSVREYYEKDGTWLPGKKGITMTLEQYTELLKVLPQIEKTLGKDGESVGRPDYGDNTQTGARETSVKAEDDDDDEDEEDEGGDDDSDVGGAANGKSKRRSNIEATSDEDEDDE